MISFLMRRVAGRIIRQIVGEDREPVTQSRLRGADMLLIVWAATFGSCFTALLLVAFFGNRLLNAMCGG